MRKAEAQGSGAAQAVTAVMLGGLLALGVALMMLLLGAVAVSNGILKEDAAAQVTAAACVAGCWPAPGAAPNACLRAWLWAGCAAC